jgi:hypothetical protein
MGGRPDVWVPTLPDDPIVAGWWAEAETARRYADAVADARRARKIERLLTRCREIDCLAAGVLEADQRRRDQRSARSSRYRDERSARSPDGRQIESWGARPQVERRGVRGGAHRRTDLR